VSPSGEGGLGGRGSRAGGRAGPGGARRAGRGGAGRSGAGPRAAPRCRSPVGLQVGLCGRAASRKPHGPSSAGPQRRLPGCSVDRPSADGGSGASASGTAAGRPPRNAARDAGPGRGACGETRRPGLRGAARGGQRLPPRRAGQRRAMAEAAAAPVRAARALGRAASGPGDGLGPAHGAAGPGEGFRWPGRAARPGAPASGTPGPLGPTTPATRAPHSRPGGTEQGRTAVPAPEAAPRQVPAALRGFPPPPRLLSPRPRAPRPGSFLCRALGPCFPPPAPPSGLVAPGRCPARIPQALSTHYVPSSPRAAREGCMRLSS
jgi:hypothetical protein